MYMSHATAGQKLQCTPTEAATAVAPRLHTIQQPAAGYEPAACWTDRLFCWLPCYSLLQHPVQQVAAAKKASQQQRVAASLDAFEQLERQLQQNQQSQQQQP
jgi:hypothetical protein